MNYKNQILFFLSLFFVPVFALAQSSVSISGLTRHGTSKAPISYVSILIKTKKDSSFVGGTITNEEGRFTLSGIKSGTYLMEALLGGYVKHQQEIIVGTLSAYLDLGNIELFENVNKLTDVIVTASKQKDGVNEKMDKKVFAVGNNISQVGGSVLQAMQNLPGVTVQDGKVQLRGNDKVAILIDGKQSAITGFNGQTGLDNLPASAIERIEIINNPSAIYDANGNAGIINIIYKKNKQEGFNGKIGIMGGLGALWERKPNLPTIRPQFSATPKLNPSISLNYRKNKLNTFLQGDWLYTQTLNRNEFSERTYTNGIVINQQVKRNRTTTFATVKTGIDWTPDVSNSLTVSGYFNREKILDDGDVPYFNKDFSQRLRLWQFLEDEVKYTAIASASYQHKFKQPGHQLTAGFNYTFHREDEQYFFTNIMPTFTGQDAFKLLSDEHVSDLNVDYVRPLKHGRIETGIKFRYRSIPTNMQFFPGLNSPIDSNAGGWANYKETIPAVYGNYVFENNNIELEAGLRMEYVKVDYDVNPNHPTYTSDGYNYAKPFPTIRFGYKVNNRNKLTAFFNQRVDRPNEVDIRIFPKYDEPELLKVGNPTLRPQFTNRFEIGYKLGWFNGSLTTSLYHNSVDATITRIATIVPGNTLIYNIFQNAGKSSATGIETFFQQEFSKSFTANLSGALYHNIINAFTINNKYPVPTIYTMEETSITSGNIKANLFFKLPGKTDLQLTAIWLAPDIIPQGRIESRFSIDLGVKKQIQKEKGELFLNATDLFNTLVLTKVIIGNGFTLRSSDYLETQVFRLGYSYKF
jgi:outer membrane receptor protein involved in Fe transport